MPAARAWRSTVCSSHISAEFFGSVMTWAPVARLAIHFDMRQRNERAAETEDRAEDQQLLEVEPIGRQETIRTEQAGNDEQHQHHGDIGHQKQRDSLHGSKALA